MSSKLIDGPCPNPKCLTLIPYEIGQVDDRRALIGTCKVCGAYRAYDGARNITVLPEE